MVFQFPRETQRSSMRRLPFRQERNCKDSSRAPTRMSCPIASLPSLLFLSPTSSSRLMTLRFVTAGALDDFSTGILASTHVLSPHPSIVNSAFPKINLLAIVHSHFMLRQARAFLGLGIRLSLNQRYLNIIDRDSLIRGGQQSYLWWRLSWVLTLWSWWALFWQ